eukprot:2593940-Prorocentrum_lima.AAC.1
MVPSCASTAGVTVTPSSSASSSHHCSPCCTCSMPTAHAPGYSPAPNPPFPPGTALICWECRNSFLLLLASW